MAVQLSFDAKEHEKTILDLAANHHPALLAEQYQQSRRQLQKIDEVSSDEKKQAFRDEATRAKIILQAVNKVTEGIAIDEEQPLSQARGNVMRLEEQLKEVSQHMNCIAVDATKEALEKLDTEKALLSQQVLHAQDIVMRFLAAPHGCKRCWTSRRAL